MRNEGFQTLEHPSVMKSKRGSAYVLVIVAALVVLTLMLTVLTITAASRNITGRYSDFYGLYDVAVAGNLRAFDALQAARQARYQVTYPYARYYVIDFDDFFAPGPGCAHFTAPACSRSWWYEWTFSVNFDDARGAVRGAVQSDFFALTIICDRGDAFYIETRIRKNSPFAPETVVRMTANFLDCNTLEMLELFRVAI
ncbi:MAG: hypothetical protein FWC70_11555 [Defluviitaleaceae bacterium]|nr:hypothetical protein [Defluviitaleaceae bacterium]